jgi:spore germination protein KB
MRKPEKVKKAVLGGMTLGLMVMLAVVIRDIAMLGGLAWMYSLPTYESLRLINVGEIITRIEVLFAFTMLFLLFFKISIYFYAAAQIIVQIFKLNALANIAVSLGGLIAALPLILFESSSANVEFAMNIAPFYLYMFQIVIPLITLTVAMVRFPKGQNAPPQQMEQQQP